MKRSIAIGLLAVGGIVSALILVGVPADGRGDDAGAAADAAREAPPADETPALAETSTVSKSPQAVVREASVAPGAAGLRAYRDPATGGPGGPPSGSEVRAAGVNHFTVGGLEEVPSPVPGGGVLLRGNFQQAFRLVRRENGETSAECVPAERPAALEERSNR